MPVYDHYEQYLPILSKARIFSGIPAEEYPNVFAFLHVTIKQYKKDALLQRLGEPLLCSGIVLEGMVEGSFISEDYNKINMNHFTPGRSFAEALACVQTTHSPIQLKALTECTIMFLDLKQLLSAEECDCSFRRTLSVNLITILASQNVFTNLKYRIASQRAMRDKIVMYLYSLTPDKEGFVHVPFTQTALAEFLGVNRSALSRELGNMQNEGLLTVNGRAMKLLV